MVFFSTRAGRVYREMKESAKKWGSLRWCHQIPRLDPIPRVKTRAWGPLAAFMQPGWLLNWQGI